MNPSRIAKIASILFVAKICTGCAVRYTQRIPGFQPGYTDKQLGESTFQIKIGEAWPKDWPDLEKFAIYRAADITESKSKRYFVVLNASTQTSTYYISSPSTSNTTATATRVGNTVYLHSATATMPGTTGAISGGWYILDFKVLSASELPNYSRVIDSQQVKRDLQYFINSRR